LPQHTNKKASNGKGQCGDLNYLGLNRKIIRAAVREGVGTGGRYA
jgi:hypothetical protein